MKNKASNSNLVSLFGERQSAFFLAAIVLMLGLMATGCKSPKGGFPGYLGPYEEVTLSEGDVIQLSFPGAPTQDSNQQIRRDGKITTKLGAEVMARGKTPAQLEQELLRIYGPKLVDKQVVVTVSSAEYSVFVSGAVLRPGKIVTARPITALEAIMEGGGFDYNSANLKRVTVLRNIEGKTVRYELNLDAMIQGEKSKPFHLRPLDIVYVPDRFTWF